jgi:hypothetical protein
MNKIDDSTYLMICRLVPNGTVSTLTVAAHEEKTLLLTISALRIPRADQSGCISG